MYRFNVCDGSVQRVRELCDDIRESVFKPLLANPSTNFTNMAEALLVGMKPVVLFLNKDAFLEFTRRAVDLPEQNPPKAYARYTLAALVYVLTTLLAIRWLAVVFRPILNVLLRFSVYCNLKLPLLAACMLGSEALRNESVESVTCAKHQHLKSIGDKFKSFIPRVRLEV